MSYTASVSLLPSVARHFTFYIKLWLVCCSRIHALYVDIVFSLYYLTRRCFVSCPAGVLHSLKSWRPLHKLRRTISSPIPMMELTRSPPTGTGQHNPLTIAQGFLWWHAHVNIECSKLRFSALFVVQFLMLVCPLWHYSAFLCILRLLSAEIFWLALNPFLFGFHGYALCRMCDLVR